MAGLYSKRNATLRAAKNQYVFQLFGGMILVRVLITSFDYPEESCKPRGMSGCGVWSIPTPTKGEIWSAGKTQLLGILRGHYPDAKMLRFARIERVLRLLTDT